MKLVKVMSFLVLTFVSLCSSISNCLKNSKEKSSCLCKLKKRSIMMGSFHDVGADKNGALIY
jgi:hypothetical protein